MASAYNPTAVESAWYEWWNKEGYFKPSLKQDGSIRDEGIFVVPMPPPNVTGNLHIGHALTIAIQDTLVRWHRMQGKTVLYHPGFDHAGIATQSVVEKRLYKQTNQTRHDLGREKFLEQVWNWREDYQKRITSQLKRLGGSYDWTRARFTMDESMSKAVTENFCRLHEEGIIYRANRLVNWCTQLNTALSNLEVEQKELPGRTMLSVPGYDPKEKFEFGVITSFAYPVADSDEKIIVATTRPETMLGDTAVAVHPDDARYKHLHGKFVQHPFLDRRIPIITDAEAVDMEFGTGAVKITPAHDPNDYEVGLRHNLEFINILNDNGTFNANAGPEFEGMKRFHARQTVVEKLKEKGLFIETKDNAMAIPLCERSGDVIEPIIKPQWWVDCKGMAAEAVRATKAGKLKIEPKLSENEWYRWMENIQDWCISRQLWWGHRVPAYYVEIAGEADDRTDDKRWVSGRSLEEATAKAEKIAAGKKYTLHQDEDVLDTWFSSGLWPFSIQGWPSKSKDFANFYPATLLETGWDILFFWVARMVMLGIKLTGEVPFSEVFCHAMIRDAHGRKMSKSLGNVIDPIDVMEGITLADLQAKLLDGNLAPAEIQKAQAGQKADYPNGIPQCGADALRFTLLAYNPSGRDINLDILRVEGYRKFCNKIWNALAFAFLKLGEDFKPAPHGGLSGKESLSERWILHKMNEAAKNINLHLEEKNFMQATTDIYNFWLYELCDVYIENIKPVTEPNSPAQPKRSAQDTLYTCLEGGLRMLHPFMPFVTEELYQRLPRRPSDITATISLTRYPTYDAKLDDAKAASDFDLAFDIVKAIRSLAKQYDIKAGIIAYAHAAPEAAKLVQTEEASIKALVKGCSELNVIPKTEASPEGCSISVINEDVSILVLIKGHVDVDVEVGKLEKKKQKTEQLIASIQKLKAGATYETKVPASVRETNEQKLRTYEEEIEALTTAMQNFLKLK